MAKYFYPAIFETEDVGYSVYVPDLEGCYSQGETLEEAVSMIKDAIGLYLDGMQEGKYIKASNPKDISVEDNQFVMMVEFDKIEYDKKYNTKAVKKTLTIPSWLNELAEENHINFSSVLQSALKEKLQVQD